MATRPNGTIDLVRWQQLKAILADALQQDSAEARVATIERSCGHDALLFSEAESLLAEAEALLNEASDDLEACAEHAGTMIPRDSISEIGRRVGAYVIVSEIGHGGMGSVYLAARADGYFQKQVAIKILNGGRDRAELARRFRSEREVLARLEHPNITRLLDAGAMEDGRPYIVMEYVDGTPVTRFAQENNLTLRARLELFLKICAAVEVAHRHSIIHRDLKPNNILVNRDGETKLLDFGIAKLIADDASPLELTAFGQERLTPVAASPEQAQGELVTKSTDIYSLGALLYELLTGFKPHHFQNPYLSRAELINVVCEQDPPLPSSRAVEPRTKRLLRGDLDAIVLRALRKDPRERYPSVAEFADDVRRYLAGDVVIARSSPTSWIVRRMFHKSWVRLSLLAIGLALLSWGVLFSVNKLRGTEERQKTAAAPGMQPSANPESSSDKSIAIFPFVSLNPDANDGYFLDGVQDNIITDLGKVADLKVIGRSSVLEYRGTNKDLRQIAQALGVSYLLEGSAQKSGDRIRVNARLIAARTNTQVWAQSYDRKEGDLFLLESELAQEIVSQLKATLSPTEKIAMETQPTRDMAAYDLYLRAREAFLQYDVQKTIELLDSAVARDPKFALAYCLLAEAHLYAYRFMDGSDPSLAAAKKAADTALAIAPELSDAHLAQAQYYYYGPRDFAKAQKELESAPFPSDRARFLDLSALTKRRLGRWKDSIADAEKAVELDPHNPFVTNELAESYLAVRRFGDAVQFVDRAMKRLPPKSDTLWCYKASGLLGLGKLDEARAVLEQRPIKTRGGDSLAMQLAIFGRDFDKASKLASSLPLRGTRFYFEGLIALGKGDQATAKSSFEMARDFFAKRLADAPDDPSALGAVSEADARLGRKKEAVERAQLAIKMLPLSRDAVDAVKLELALAEIQACLGEDDAALKQLARVVKLPGGTDYGQLLVDPIWDKLRPTRAFQEILARAAEPPEYD